MVLERVKALAAEQFDVEEDTLGSDTTFAQLGADSLDIAEFAAALEEEFDIELDDDAADSIETIGDAVSAVKKNRR